MNSTNVTCAKPKEHMGKLHRFSHRHELATLDKLLATDETTNFVQTVYQLTAGTSKSLLAITNRRVLVIGPGNTETVEIADVLDVEVKSGKKLLDFQTLQLVTNQGQELEVNLDLSEKKEDKIISLLMPSNPRVAMAKSDFVI
jgi:hypothetical protein